MSKPKTAPPKELTAKQLAAQKPFADGPAPGLGGAWVRNADGSLSRDEGTDQHIPEDEGKTPEQPPADIPPPPAGPDTAGLPDTANQEG